MPGCPILIDIVTQYLKISNSAALIFIPICVGSADMGFSITMKLIRNVEDAEVSVEPGIGNTIKLEIYDSESNTLMVTRDFDL